MTTQLLDPAQNRSKTQEAAGPAIKVEKIVKRYGDFEAVKGIDFEVANGEIFGLLGPNGAGKSTLIRMMTTLIPITAGRALIGGRDVSKEPNAVRNVIGVIPQALTSDIDLTVEENLSIYAKLYSVPKAIREKNIAEVLEAVDLTKWRGAQTKTLSGGMRRRLEIARGLVHNPQIFFLDEPTTGLDPVSRIAVWEMLNNLKKTRNLTMLLTTHYMEEADRLCDRIAIVDHGTLVALDTPVGLKQSVPGSDVVEVRFNREDDQWKERLLSLAEVTDVQSQSAGVYRILTGNGSQTTTQLVAMASSMNEQLTSLSVQNTSLDDVFVHYTGRQLRDEQVRAVFSDAKERRDVAMNRFLAIVEREMRKFFRSPMLMIMSMMLPLVQLLVLGHAYGGHIQGAKIAVVDQDRGPQAVKVYEAFDSVAVNIATFTTIPYTDEYKAREDVRTGKVDAAVIIPPQYSRRVYANDAPRIALVVDNSDQVMSGALETEMQSLVDALNQPVIPDRVVKQVALEIVELYPYVEYMKYLLAGSITLAMYISVMIGGGMLYIDDKARGVHEGYLVTPISKLELVMGLNFAGAIKAVLAGICLTAIGSLMAGLGIIFNPLADLYLLLLILGTSIAFNGMMFLMMVRVDDPLVPRAMFGVLNTLLFFPSGAISPVSAFPKWLQCIAVVDPFTYAVHGLKSILLKDGGFVSIQGDLLYLFVFGFGTLLIATPLFKRTL